MFFGNKKDKDVRLTDKQYKNLVGGMSKKERKEFERRQDQLELNKNVPGFTADEITTKSYESYGELDKQGRCTPAMACLGKDLMPTEERQSISMVKPTGWKQNKYPGLVDSDPPYNVMKIDIVLFDYGLDPLSNG